MLLKPRGNQNPLRIIKPRKFKVSVFVILILLVSVLLVNKVRAFNETLYWIGGSGNISDSSHWSTNDYSSCSCVPKYNDNIFGTNSVIFNSNSGSGNVYLDTNISSGTVYISNDTNIKIIIQNNTSWIIYSPYPAFVPLNNPPFDPLSTITAAFYILAFVAGAVLFIMFAFWVRRVRGKIG